MKQLILLILFPALLFAQEESYNHKIEWNTTFNSESNGLSNNFINTMLYGGHITDAIKNDWISSGKEYNIISSELSNSISYSYSFNKKHIGFSIADRNIINARFNDDVLRMVLQGNYNYQNQTLDFSNTNIRVDRFQQYKITYGTLVKNINISGEFSYLKGNHHLSYSIDKGSIYTSDYGTFLDVNYNMDAFITDTANLNPFATNGNGLALGINTHFTIKRHDINFFLTDLGFIMWNPTATTLVMDSSFNFAGIEVDDILSFNDSIIDTYNIQDELETRRSSFKTYIPANIGFSVTKATNFSIFSVITAGIHAKWQAYKDDSPLSFSKIGQGLKESNYAPLYYLKSEIPLKYLTVSPTLSHGGYSNNFNLDLSLSFSIKKKTDCILGSQHLEDLALGKKATSLSIYLKLITQF